MGLISAHNINDYIFRYGCKVFIETGTGHGTSLEHVLQYPFEEIYSCEIRPEQAAKMQGKFSGDKRVQIINATSIEALEILLPRIAQTCLIWLDAHYRDYRRDYDYKTDPEGHLPLKAELELIKKYRHGQDIIISDDLRIYKKADYEHGNLSDFGHEFIAQYNDALFAYKIMGARYNIEESLKDEGYLIFTPLG